VRILDGPNVHLPRPAIQVRLQVDAFMEAGETTFAVWVRDAGGPPNLLAAVANADQAAVAVAVGPPRSTTRAAAVADLVRYVAVRLAKRGGVRNLKVVLAPGWESGELIVAFPWRRLTPAERLARYIAYVLEDLGTSKLSSTLARVTERLNTSPAGERAWVPEPHVPTVGITGTNGKTTTTRMIGNLLVAAGRRAAWNSTDGVYVDGRLVEAGDWAGFGGAGRVLETPSLDVAVLEIARGGILRRGIGVRHLDVAVVTNVTADHLGELGIHDLEDLARAKAAIVAIVRPGGWVVLNAEDPRVLAMRERTHANVCAFSLDPAATGLAEVVAGGGRALTVSDGWLVLRDGSAGPQAVVAHVPIVAISEVPATLGGISRHNLANAMGATGALLALGVEAEQVAVGLRAFVPDADVNPGRLNLWALDGRTVLVDVAHNEDSLDAMLDVARRLVPEGARMHALTGSIGDRPDHVIVRLGELSVQRADVVAFAQKERFLRGRDPAELVELLQHGAKRAGRDEPVPVHDDELVGLAAMLDRTEPGDVVAFAVHAHLGDVNDWLRARGATMARVDELPGRHPA